MSRAWQKTAERKLTVAQRLFDIAVNDHGLLPQDLVVDALTFTLATGDPEYSDSAKETLEGIRLIKKELPGTLTSLVSAIVHLVFHLPPGLW